MKQKGILLNKKIVVSSSVCFSSPQAMSSNAILCVRLEYFLIQFKFKPKGEYFLYPFLWGTRNAIILSLIQKIE